MDVTTFVFFVAGIVLLIVGAEFLVRGASRLAVAAGIAPLVVGLTVVAYGTSAPELAVTVQSTYAGQPDIAIGNVVGSNISNLLLVLGISAVISPLAVSRQLVRSSVPLMIGVSVLVWLLGRDGKLGALDGTLLTAGALLYTALAIYRSRLEMKALNKSQQPDEQEKPKPTARQKRLGVQLLLIVAGLAMLVIGAGWLVDGAVKVAKMLGVTELVIGLTIVAVGTSLPEIATSIVASMRGERDIAVGNVVGSNIFNVLLVLGVCSLVSPGGVAVAQTAIHFDLPVMIAVAVASLPVFFTGYVIDRWEGMFFLIYYAAYTAYLYMKATEHEGLGPFSLVMFAFVIPITVLTLVMLTIRSMRRNQRVKTT